MRAVFEIQFEHFVQVRHGLLCASAVACYLHVEAACNEQPLVLVQNLAKFSLHDVAAPWMSLYRQLSHSGQAWPGSMSSTGNSRRVRTSMRAQHFVQLRLRRPLDSTQ